ncbi:MAG: hypothetical protein C6I00_06735 [Nitratiruptor sp.]|nr:hypothetical protein [Nitratiruptor sp.]NPA83732.1 hypothetical protein [Campylobacterota bacterium]
MEKLFEGNRGEIFLIDYRGEKAILKRLRPGKPNTLSKEGAILRHLKRYVPKLYEVGPDYLIMEYIQGVDLKEALRRQPRRAIRLALEACYYLDGMGIYHKELGRYRHILYEGEFDRVRVIDFERATWRPDPRNLLQFVGFYLRGYDLAPWVELYKRDRHQGFQAILEALDV